MKPVEVVDIFCGCGGLSTGLEQAGLTVVAGIDNEPTATWSFAANHPKAACLTRDIKSVMLSEVERYFSRNAISVIAGGAPCQPFSNLTQGIKKHPKRDLLEDYIGLCVDVLPDVIILENVPSLLSRGQDKISKAIATLELAGYKISYGVVKCEFLGLPQARRRFILIASRIGKIELTIPTQGPIQTVIEAIGHLPKLEQGETDQEDRFHSASAVCRRAHENIKHHDCAGRDGRAYSGYLRMENASPSPTITTKFTEVGSGQFVHPTQDRGMTFREGAILQGFPDGYKFWPEDKKIVRRNLAMLIGNAVPPPLGYHVGSLIMDHVRRENEN